MDLVYKKLHELRPYERNPRKNDEAVRFVEASIREFGFKVPIVIDSAGVIVAGHTRYKAALKLSMASVPCIVADDLSDEQIKAFRLADNKIAELAEWDIDLLGQELDDILDLDMSEFGFDEPEVREDIVEDDFDPSDDVPSRVQPGEVWRLGRHLLLCGDGTDTAAVGRMLGDDNIDLLLTDPPYNVNYTGGTQDRLTIQNDNMEDSDFRRFLAAAFRCAGAYMAPGAAFYIWHADSEGYNFRAACSDAGWQVRQCLIWVKDRLVLGRQDYQWKHEPCLYGWLPGGAHYWAGGRKQRTTITGFDIYDLREKKKEELLKLFEIMWCDAEDYETSVLYEERPTASREHPTMKPVKLIARQVTNSCAPKGRVLDLFGGSGTTLIACEQLDRDCRMVELDPHYADVIISRWEAFTGKEAELVGTG